MKNTTKNLLKKFKMNKYNLISLPTIDLSPEEADRFIDYMVDESVMKDYARIVRMNKPTKNIRAIGFGSGKALYPGNHFDESKYKKQWIHNLIALTSKKIRGCIAIFDDDLEDNIEGDAFADHLMKIFAAKAANELEEAFWIGETVGLNGFAVDDIRGILDGWRYRIVTGQTAGQTYYNDVSGGSHVKNACECQSGGDCPSGVDNADAHFELPGLIAERHTAAPYDWEFKYHLMLKNMPSKYKARNGLGKMAFLNSDLVTQDYIGALSARSTALGDAVFTGAVKPAYGKVKILDVPLMASNLGSPLTGNDGVIGAGEFTDSLLTLKNNLIVGIQRDIKIESQRVAADEATYIFYTMRVDVAIENVNATVLTRCLEHNC